MRRSIINANSMFSQIKQVQSRISLNFTSARNLFIQVQDTPNPMTLKFLPGKPILGEGRGTIQFDSFEEAKRSPLATELLRVAGVKSVFFGEDFISITKNGEDVQWSLVKPDTFAIIMDFLQSDRQIMIDGSLPAGPSDTVISPDDDDTVALIKELIESRIKPMVQEDGGDVIYVGFRNGVVQLKLQGSCTGCPSSSITLKSGIKNMLQFYVPEVSDVVEVSGESDDVITKAFNEMEEKLRGSTK